MKILKLIYSFMFILFLVSILPISVYTFYIAMRWIVLILGLICLILTYIKYKELDYIQLIIIILWNPIFPIYLNKSIWVVFDIASCLYYLFKNKSNNEI